MNRANYSRDCVSHHSNPRNLVGRVVYYTSHSAVPSLKLISLGGGYGVREYVIHSPNELKEGGRVGVKNHPVPKNLVNKEGGSGAIPI